MGNGVRKQRRSGAAVQPSIRPATWINGGAGGRVVIGNELLRVPRRGRRAADAGWISPAQLEELPPAGQRPHGIPFSPAFIVEIRSSPTRSNRSKPRWKNGLPTASALGWLIDPFLRQVHVYRPDAEPQILDDPEIVSGDPELPGFVFNVRRRVFDLQ